MNQNEEKVVKWYRQIHANLVVTDDLIRKTGKLLFSMFKGERTPLAEFALKNQMDLAELEAYVSVARGIYDPRLLKNQRPGRVAARKLPIAEGVKLIEHGIDVVHHRTGEVKHFSIDQISAPQAALAVGRSVSEQRKHLDKRKTHYEPLNVSQCGLNVVRGHRFLMTLVEFEGFIGRGLSALNKIREQPSNGKK